VLRASILGGGFIACEFDRRQCGAGRPTKGLRAVIGRLGTFVVCRGDVIVEFLDTFKEVGDVQEGVAIESDIDKGRLHAWQHACDTTFVNAPD
jgi:hypothetical protein